MKNLLTPEIHVWRQQGADPIVAEPGFKRSKAGIFLVPSCIDAANLVVIASNSAGWDHVSVSRAKRCPNWPEMSQIHRLFFEPHEAAYQLHVPGSDHINVHPYCLHIWRPQTTKIAMPPKEMIA